MSDEQMRPHGNILIFPRDRYQGAPPAVPDAADPNVGVAILGFAERIVSLTKLGVAPQHFRKAIEDSPVQEQIERAIGRALLRETTAPDLTQLTDRSQGLRVSGGPTGLTTKVSCAGAPVLVRSLELQMNGNDDHVAKVEAYLEPPNGLVFRIDTVTGLADVAMAHGFMLVPLMEKELRDREYRTNLPEHLYGRMTMNGNRAARVELVRVPAQMLEGEAVDRVFEGALQSPIAGLTVKIRARDVTTAVMSWSLLAPGAMREIGAERCWEQLREAVSLELLQLVALPTGYKLRQLTPKAE